MAEYINLTSGIDFYEDDVIRGDYNFVRIQSTALEQKRWDFIIQDLDYKFLLELAIGVPVRVLDCSARKEQSRAIYQGLPFIAYILNRHWFNIDYEKVFVKAHNVRKYFENVYDKMSGKTLKKLDFFKKFEHLNKEQRVILSGVTVPTTLDSDYKSLAVKLGAMYGK
jgi:hypothetical protein